MGLVTYVKAGPGKIFVLTDKGRQIGRIAVKYDNGRAAFNGKYQRSAPKAWLEQGYIEEKDCGGNGNGIKG